MRSVFDGGEFGVHLPGDPPSDPPKPCVVDLCGDQIEIRSVGRDGEAPEWTFRIQVMESENTTAEFESLLEALGLMVKRLR